MMRQTLSVLFFFLVMAFPAKADILPGDMPLTTAFAEKLVNAELTGFNNTDAFKVTIDQPILPLGNQDARPTQIVLDGLRHEPSSGRFRAVMIGTIEGEPRFELPLEGRVQELVNVAVLARSIGRGELISAADLEWRAMAPDALSQTSLTDELQLIGAEARRRLSPGRMLTSRDVGPPRVVLRGQSVRLVYTDGGLKLTALGTAKDDAGFGEPVRVMNPESRMVIQGVATGHHEVTVGNSAIPSDISRNTGSNQPVISSLRN